MAGKCEHRRKSLEAFKDMIIVSDCCSVMLTIFSTFLSVLFIDKCNTEKKCHACQIPSMLATLKLNHQYFLSDPQTKGILYHFVYSSGILY